MGPASERLHAAIVECRLSHRDESPLNAHVRQMVLYRDAYRCQLCHRAAAEVDHIQPVIDGGSDHPSNLRSLCHHCHATR